MPQTTRPSTPLAPNAAIDRDRDFAAIALPLLPNIKRFALSLTRNEADADDIVQETFLRAYRYWGTFETGTDCRRWLGQRRGELRRLGQVRASRMIGLRAAIS